MEVLCKKCGSTVHTKNGIVRGKQRYKCKSCGHNFIEGDLRRQVSDEGKALAVLLYGRGKASYGFIAKLFNVSSVAVMKWLKGVARELAEPTLDNSITGVQFDEMWHFVVKKDANCGFGGQWTVVTVEPSAGILALAGLRHSNNSLSDSRA